MSQSLCAALLLCTTQLAHAAELTTPLPTRNLYPPMMRFFDPTPDSALRPYDQAWSAELNIHYTTINLYDRLPKPQLLVDMELAVIEPVIRRAINRQMELSLRIPVLLPTNGVFDGAIQRFHSWFHMPNGGRQYRPNNAYGYQMNNGKGAGWQSKNHAEAGNVELSARYQLSTHSQWSLATLAAIKLPTASKPRGWGSGALDIGAGAVLSGSRGDWFGHLEGWLVQPLARNIPGVHYLTYGRGSLTAGYHLWHQTALIVQVQGGSSPYRSGINQLDQAPFLIAFGLRGSAGSTNGWTLTITENITQQTTQDIAIAAGWSWIFNKD
ncbi:MAG: DUF3187 family protein [Mariprofundales bacterium]